MKPFFEEKFGNVARGHAFGFELQKPVEVARKQVADLIGAKQGASEQSSDVLPTSIRGVAKDSQRGEFVKLSVHTLELAGDLHAINQLRVEALRR